jgi:hypothetical protein
MEIPAVLKNPYVIAGGAVSLVVLAYFMRGSSPPPSAAQVNAAASLQATAFNDQAAVAITQASAGPNAQVAVAQAGYGAASFATASNNGLSAFLAQLGLMGTVIGANAATDAAHANSVAGITNNLITTSANRDIASTLSDASMHITDSNNRAVVDNTKATAAGNVAQINANYGGQADLIKLLGPNILALTHDKLTTELALSKDYNATQLAGLPILVNGQVAISKNNSDAAVAISNNQADVANNRTIANGITGFFGGGGGGGGAQAVAALARPCRLRRCSCKGEEHG